MHGTALALSGWEVSRIGLVQTTCHRAREGEVRVLLDIGRRSSMPDKKHSAIGLSFLCETKRSDNMDTVALARGLQVSAKHLENKSAPRV